MKSILALCIASTLVFGHLQAKAIFVSKGGTGNGESWATAMGDLHRALKIAEPGDQVWVAKGTYRTTEDNDRSRSFIIPAGVELYGGFAGTETAAGQRNLQKNITYLSGEIGTASLHDNAFTVVLTRNVGDNTVVDGFFIIGGAANGAADNSPLEARGAGWYNLATDGQASSPTIRHCTIANNFAREGAGMYNLAMENGKCRPTIVNCSFINNKAEQNGGAIINVSINGQCSPIITDCLFDSNQAANGGGLFNESRSGSVRPVIQSNIFRNNQARVRNGSIHNGYFGRGICEPVIENNYYEGNSSLIGKEKNTPSPPAAKRKSEGAAGYKK